MTERLCWVCLAGRVVELEVGAVCTACKRYFPPAEIAPLPPLAELLVFAQAHPKANGRQIREAFGISMLRYAAFLNRSLDDPAAMELSPAFVEAMRERRDQLRGLRHGVPPEPIEQASAS